MADRKIETKTGAAREEAMIRFREEEAAKKVEAEKKEKENLAKVLHANVEDIETTGKSAKDLVREIYNEKVKKSEAEGEGKGILEIIGLKKTAIGRAQNEKKNMTKGLEYITGENKIAGEYIKGIRPKYETLNKLLEKHDELTEMIEKETPAEKVEKFKQLKKLEGQISEFLKFMAKEPNVGAYGYNSEKGKYEDRTKYAGARL